MEVYRIHIRPTGGLDDQVLSFSYCLKEQVLGLGWQTETQINGVSWEKYEREAVEIYGSKGLSRVRYLKNNIKEGDLIWTRNTKGEYYLAKVKSGWEYYTNKEAQDADITNIVRCEIMEVQVDEVPGKVVACFRPPRAVQAIRDDTAVNYSKLLWNKISKTTDYQLSIEKHDNVFSFLDSKETEDVIFIYLQTEGWVVIPGSRKVNTMNYEFYLIHKETKEKAIVQVKTGHTPIPNNLERKKEKVFLFQASGIYKGKNIDNVICLTPKEIEQFMYSNQDLMPKCISYWFDIMGI